MDRIDHNVYKAPIAAATTVPHATRSLCQAIPLGTRNITEVGGMDGYTGEKSPSPPSASPHLTLTRGEGTWRSTHQRRGNIGSNAVFIWTMYCVPMAETLQLTTGI